MATTLPSKPVVICASCGATAPAIEARCAGFQAWDPTLMPEPGRPATWTYLRCAHCGSTALAQRLRAFGRARLRHRRSRDARVTQA